MKNITLIVNDCEFNLATMYKNTIVEAFEKFPEDTLDKIAEKLCIGSSTLYRYMRIFNIKRLSDDN